MDTQELETVLRKNVSTQKTFLGVFALDQLPTSIELRKAAERYERWFIVCNCCPASQPGRHWIAVFYERGTVEFFDSFALPPDNYDRLLTTFLHHATNACEVVYNNVPLQSIDSDACGHYCVLFGVARSRGQSFRSILDEMTALNRDNLMKFIVNTLL